MNLMTRQLVNQLILFYLYAYIGHYPKSGPGRPRPLLIWYGSVKDSVFGMFLLSHYFNKVGFPRFI